jgi:hypothetical protein
MQSHFVVIGHILGHDPLGLGKRAEGRSSITRFAGELLLVPITRPALFAGSEWENCQNEKPANLELIPSPTVSTFLAYPSKSTKPEPAGADSWRTGE